jgi:DNA-3-methyladenine glycosylase I
MQCTWPANDEQMLHYHDTEWGIPVHDDKKHFEFIVLDSFQAGLNWKTILHRRKHLQYFFYLFHLKSNELKLA